MTNSFLLGSLIVVLGILAISLWLYYFEAFLQAFRHSKPEYRWLVLFVPGTIFFPELFREDGEIFRRKCVKFSVIALLVTVAGILIILN